MNTVHADNGLSFELIQQLPKVELHAHLSGSIAQEKLNELLERKEKKQFETFNCLQDFGTSTEAVKRCFDYFSAVSHVVTDLSSLEDCTQSVLEKFADENCIYLELRTEPKAFESGNTTPEQYVDVIKECAVALNSPLHRMDVKLVLSIKRDYSYANSVEMVVGRIDKMIDISKKYSDFVVGIDICGNPADQTIISSILPALIQRQNIFQTLPITFHIGEMEDDDECDAVIENITRLNIRRLGHVIHLKEHHIKKVSSIGEKGYVLGIEICPTSNLVTSQYKDMKKHHFGKWWGNCSQNILFSINTDDRGLFSCSLTSEVYKLASSFGLSLKELCDIQKQAILSSFYPNKEELVKKIDQFYYGYIK